LPLLKLIEPVEHSVERTHHQSCGEVQLLTQKKSVEKRHHLQDTERTAESLTLQTQRNHKNNNLQPFIAWYVMVTLYNKVHLLNIS